MSYNKNNRNNGNNNYQNHNNNGSKSHYRRNNESRDTKEEMKAKEEQRNRILGYIEAVCNKFDDVILACQATNDKIPAMKDLNAEVAEEGNWDTDLAKKNNYLVTILYDLAKCQLNAYMVTNGFHAVVRINYFMERFVQAIGLNLFKEKFLGEMRNYPNLFNPHGRQVLICSTEGADPSGNVIAYTFEQLYKIDELDTDAPLKEASDDDVAQATFFEEDKSGNDGSPVEEDNGPTEATNDANA